MLSENAVMQGTWRRLIDDLSDGDTFRAPFLRGFSGLVSKDIKAVRSYVWPDVLQYPPDVARRLIQARDFGKRWIFDNDVYTDEELTDQAEQSFIRAQEKVLTSIPQSQMMHMWLQEARRVCTYVLGTYDEEEHHSHCCFGRKAAIGLPRDRAYFYNRLASLSGTERQIKRTARALRGDKLLVKAISKVNGGRPKLRIPESSTATAVPKSYKAKRLIMADSVLGGFLSLGLGSVISERLRERAGISISHAQHLHKKLARTASMTGALVTADMSRASDNISWPLLTRVMPHRWLREIRIDRMSRIQFSTSIIRAQTVMGMGKGYTFPLQTLVFYSLLRSIANLLHRAARIHVYGDDLIYPKWMHRYVVALFPQVGLVLNLDKTFADDPKTFYTGQGLADVRVYKGCFRESCGGDYFCGMDVRPCMPERRQASRHTKLQVGGFICHLLNSLCSKWGSWAIRSTTRFLLTELQALFFGGIPVVPDNLSSYSGIWASTYACIVESQLDEFTWKLPVNRVVRGFTSELKPVYNEVIEFSAICQKPQDHVVPIEAHIAYAWLWLNQASSTSDTATHQNFSGTLSASADILRRKTVKLYVTRGNKYYDRPPACVYQVVTKEVGVVDSRVAETLGWSFRKHTVPVWGLQRPL